MTKTNIGYQYQGETVTFHCAPGCVATVYHQSIQYPAVLKCITEWLQRWIIDFKNSRRIDQCEEVYSKLHYLFLTREQHG